MRSAPQEPDAPAALIPSAPAPAFGPAESVRHEREVRTDRHTVLRTEAARPGEPERPAVRAVPRTEPLLRPVAPASPGPRPAADTSRSARRAAGPPPAAGRTEDSGQLLRQGVARPAEDIAAAVLALEDEGRDPEAQALLAAFVQVHTPEDSARIAERDPRRLIPQLLGAARAVSAAHERDLVHALRVAGHLGA
ncbi:hypothetical protein HRW18_23615 [Streptomyces lunaelactis]|nr:hypothetical protein [Streptomyces lunaelactis]